MSGYKKDRTMSNNAAKAYGRGLKPLYRITNKELKEKGWKFSLGFARYLAYKKIWKNEEWHHTGHRYKKTKFYSIASLLITWNNIDEEKRISLKEKHKNSKIVSGGISVSGHYFIKNEKIEFSGILKNNTIYLEDGTIKKANGKNIWFK